MISDSINLKLNYQHLYDIYIYVCVLQFFCILKSDLKEQKHGKGTLLWQDQSEKGTMVSRGRWNSQESRL